MKVSIVLLLLSLFINTAFSQWSQNYIGDTIQAHHYTINLDEINTANHSITGWTEVILVSKVDNLNYLPLELIELEVDSVFVDNQISSFSYSGGIIRINITQSLDINDTATAVVYYHGHPFHEAWGGFHFSSDYAFNLGVGFESIPHNLGKTWFPCVDNFTDRATYDVIAKAQTGLTITAGGTLLDTINNNDNTTTWHWNIPYPIPTYLASVTIGNYIEYTDFYFGIEDTIPISIFTKPSSAGNVAGSFVNLHAIIEFFETHFGPYPFEKIGYTGTAIGAMEHVSNIAYPHSAINGTTSSEYLYTHELSHMWFGNKVTCSTAEDMWLNEGWATFCDIYYKKDLYGYDVFIEEMRDTHREVLQRAHIIDGGYWAVSDIPQNVTYGRTAYDKGGTVVNTLKNYLGDSIFFDAVTAYLNNDTIAYTSRSSSELRDFLTSYTGIDMKPFFDAWVMSPGTPHFSIDSINSTDLGSEYKIDVWVKQKYKGFDFLADDNILEITFADEDFRLVTDTIHFSGSTGHSVLLFDKAIMPNGPSAAFLDMFEKINDATTDNYSFFTEPIEYDFPETFFKLFVDQLSDSALVRVTHNWVAPDSLFTPIDGLKLSPYRYWKVEGVIPESFNARGNFFYSNSGNLDNELILSPNDSVVILYRPDTKSQWHEIPQTRYGPWAIGNIMVHEINLGEYTLAVWDKQIVGEYEYPKSEKINVYPNPTRGEINFEFPREGNYLVKLYTENGRNIDSFNVSSKIASHDININGIVMIEISENNEILLTKKVVCTN